MASTPDLTHVTAEMSDVVCRVCPVWYRGTEEPGYRGVVVRACASSVPWEHCGGSVLGLEQCRPGGQQSVSQSDLH